MARADWKLVVQWLLSCMWSPNCWVVSYRWSLSWKVHGFWQILLFNIAFSMRCWGQIVVLPSLVTTFQDRVEGYQRCCCSPWATEPWTEECAGSWRLNEDMVDQGSLGDHFVTEEAGTNSCCWKPSGERALKEEWIVSWRLNEDMVVPDALGNRFRDRRSRLRKLWSCELRNGLYHPKWEKMLLVKVVSVMVEVEEASLAYIHSLGLPAKMSQPH